MKLAFVVVLGLVAGATAAQLHLKVDTEEELSGTFKAEDGTVMHFRSTPGQVQLADEDMQEILDTEQYDEDFLEHSDAVKAVIKNANEYQVALDQEGPLAEQFVQLMAATQGFTEDVAEDDEEGEFSELSSGRRRRRRRRRSGSGKRGLTNYGNCCGQNNKCNDGRGGKNTLDNFCAKHDKCLNRGGGCGCDKDLCNNLKKSGFCRWNDGRCKSYALAAKIVMCNFKPNC